MQCPLLRPATAPARSSRLEVSSKPLTYRPGTSRASSRGPACCVLGCLDELLDCLPQNRFTAKRHPQRSDLLRINLMLRPAVQVGDLALAAGQLLGDAGHLLLRDIAIVTVEGLAGDGLGIRFEQ